MRKTIYLLLLMVTFAVSVMAQSITGTVRDETGKVMPFATVSVKDRMMSVTTDSKGHYNISKVPEGRHTLIVSFVGYETQQIDLDIKATSTTHDFTMKEASIGLKEVIVLPEGQTLQYYILSQVVKNRHNLKDIIASYDGVATCRMESMADYKVIPQSTLNKINFILALLGYKKIAKCMENHPDLRIEMAKDITFREGKLKASDTRITAFRPDSLTEEELAAFQNKDWRMDKNRYDEIYDVIENYKDKVDKITKKYPDIPVDSFFCYKGCYQEGQHIIHILKSKLTEIHVVNGLWQVRRYIKEEKFNDGNIEKTYYELQELTPDLYLPVSAYKEQTIDWTNSINKGMKKVKNTDTSQLSKRKRKKMDRSVKMMERLQKSPVWSMIKSLGFSYQNVQAVSGGINSK